MTSWITICDTCKNETLPSPIGGRGDGEALAELVETAAAKSQKIRTRRVSCLMGCSHGCNVAIQGKDKFTYTLGRFLPDADAAGAIVEYAEKHAASASGQVPFRDWPQGIKGHFITRIPAMPDEK